jgi:3-oxosteroid 1-dehydrogenase
VLVVAQSTSKGATAISGCGIWIPNNDCFKRMGGQDSHDKALTYLRAATSGRVDERRLLAYLEHAPR